MSRRSREHNPRYSRENRNRDSSRESRSKRDSYKDRETRPTSRENKRDSRRRGSNDDRRERDYDRTYNDRRGRNNDRTDNDRRERDYDRTERTRSDQRRGRDDRAHRDDRKESDRDKEEWEQAGNWEYKSKRKERDTSSLDKRKMKKRKIDYGSVTQLKNPSKYKQNLSSLMSLRQRRSEALDQELAMLEKQQGMTRKKQWDEKALKDMTKRDWRIFREEFEIVTKGGSIPNALRNDWEEADLPKWLLQNIHDCGFNKPTPIQMQAIPVGLEKRDLMGISETGSGKTAAFVIPMLAEVERLLEQSNTYSDSSQPLAIIIAPTRELTLQIERTVNDLSNRARAVALIGGMSIAAQGFEVNVGCDIILATPGRLLDCLESGYFGLDRCVYYILDEADRMTEDFEEEMIKILEISPAKDRIMMMFSATMPPAVERLANTYLNNPAWVYIGEQGLAVKNITQNIEFVPTGLEGEAKENFKRKRLAKLLREGPSPPVIIFCNRKDKCESLVKYIKSLGYTAIGLHSKKSQANRIESLDDFKDRKFQVLVATDVASRGVHVDGVNHVINFDMAKNIVIYTHRIGRTGRNGLKGTSTSFLCNSDGDLMADLKEMLDKTGNKVPMELANHPRVKGMRNVF